MDHPFPKSVTSAEKYKRLMELVSPDDTWGIVISADPDAISSAMALKRLFWRRVRKVTIFHTNPIERADNLAFIRLLKIKLQRIRSMRGRKIKRWAMVDSQPHHHPRFMNHPFDVIIDHHPLGNPPSEAAFLDIKDEYGANATLMTEYIKTAKITPSPRLATALFYGIKTDTDNFVRESSPNDMNAFRYLYPLANMNTIKKIESSEMTRETLKHFCLAMEKVVFIKDIAYINMEEVAQPDLLVMIADFFMKLADAEWSVAAGIYEEKLIIILRNAGFRGDAGKTARRLFGRWGGSAGGHKTAARAEIPLKPLIGETGDRSLPNQMILRELRRLRHVAPPEGAPS